MGFKKYDLVYIDGDPENLGIIMEDSLGLNSYKLKTKRRGLKVAWYDDHELTFIKHHATTELEGWQREQKEFEEKVTNLDYIFNNTKAFEEGLPGETTRMAAQMLGIDNLWGPRGEGLAYYLNALFISHLFRDFIKNQDKDGWLEMCNNVKLLPNEAGVIMAASCKVNKYEELLKKSSEYRDQCFSSNQPRDEPK